MRRFLLLLSSTLALGLAPRTTLSAQAVTSALTGLELPAGTTLDKGMLNRLAAKADMNMTAKAAGVTLGSQYEVYRLGPINGTAATFPVVRTLVEQQGFTVSPAQNGEPWGWIEKANVRYLLNVNVARDRTWLYLAAVAGGQPATTVASQPSAGSAETVPNAAPPAPPAQETPAPPTRPSEPPAATPPAPPAAAIPSPGAGRTPDAAAPAGAQRFQFTRTDFDDGWVATEQPDYVQLTKGNITAYLFYRVAMTDEMRPPVSDVSDYFWKRDGQPRFDIQNINRRREESPYLPHAYIEGDATDRATGQRAFVGMFVSRNNGVALNILVVAPNRETFYGTFPKPPDVERLMTYNKFAVAPADLAGHWAESSSAMAQMYYVQTGGYAGMNVASVSAEWWIAPDGTYRSEHKGATGMVGTMRTFQQKYQGAWQMSGNWEVSMTNRFEGKTDTYLAQFEVVKGARILHLSVKSSRSIQYHLMRVP